MRTVMMDAQESSQKIVGSLIRNDMKAALTLI
jgi:hypothetical protein